MQHVHSNEEMVLFNQDGDVIICCPTADTPVWNMHPRVYLQPDQNGRAVCPYCGASYQLEKDSENSSS